MPTAAIKAAIHECLDSQSCRRSNRRRLSTAWAVFVRFAPSTPAASMALSSSSDRSRIAIGGASSRLGRASKLTQQPPSSALHVILVRRARVLSERCHLTGASLNRIAFPMLRVLRSSLHSIWGHAWRKNGRASSPPLRMPLSIRRRPDWTLRDRSRSDEGRGRDCGHCCYRRSVKNPRRREQHLKGRQNPRRNQLQRKPLPQQREREQERPRARPRGGINQALAHRVEERHAPSVVRLVALSSAHLDASV